MVCLNWWIILIAYFPCQAFTSNYVYYQFNSLSITVAITYNVQFTIWLFDNIIEMHFFLNTQKKLWIWWVSFTSSSFRLANHWRLTHPKIFTQKNKVMRKNFIEIFIMNLVNIKHAFFPRTNSHMNLKKKKSNRRTIS